MTSQDMATILVPKQRYIDDYVKLYLDTVQRVALEADPNILFWPSSPSNGVKQWGNPAEHARGDIHYWAVWHGNKPFSAYMEIKPRFCSEFGFQSLPSQNTLRHVLSDDDDWSINSPQMEYRQRSPIQGNRCIVEHTMRQFRFPNNFINFIFVSQVLQGLSIKAGVEHWRRIMPYCMGAIYWQLNDIWQGASWSSLEHSGTWKVLHNFAKHFFAPQLISSFEKDNNVEIWVTSDVPAQLEVSVDIRLVSFTENRVVKHVSRTVSLNHNHSAAAFSENIELFLGEYKKNECFLSYSARARDLTSTNFHFFVPFKSLKLQKVPLNALTVEHIVNEDAGHSNDVTLKLTATQTLLFVYLQPKDHRIEGHFSDNAVMLLPNEPHLITFAHHNTKHVIDMQRGVHEAFNVTHLQQTYP
jgi:beta-mannosidase